jgi:hypothetical protein
MIDDSRIRRCSAQCAASRPSTTRQLPTCCSRCRRSQAPSLTSSVDLNPLVIADGRPIPVDALVEVTVNRATHGRRIRHAVRSTA